MAKARQLAKLFQALGSANLSAARSAAREIAESEERAGHHGAAAVLRSALATSALVDNSASESIGKPTDLFGVPEALTPVNLKVPLDSVELTDAARSTLAAVIQEHHLREHLRRNGVPPRSRLLFHGPPGSGKTLTALALGTELQLPVFVVRFDAVVGSLLGQTSSRIRDIFRFAEATPSVVLLDEIDVLGRRRGQASDVRELDRVVVTLMQYLDLVQPSGLLVAATNLPADLDPALARRFDMQIAFPVPTTESLRAFARRRMAFHRLRSKKSVEKQVLVAESYADAERLVVQARRTELMREV